MATLRFQIPYDLGPLHSLKTSPVRIVNALVQIMNKWKPGDVVAYSTYAVQFRRTSWAMAAILACKSESLSVHTEVVQLKALVGVAMAQHFYRTLVLSQAFTYTDAESDFWQYAFMSAYFPKKQTGFTRFMETCHLFREYRRYVYKGTTVFLPRIMFEELDPNVVKSVQLQDLGYEAMTYTTHPIALDYIISNFTNLYEFEWTAPGLIQRMFAHKFDYAKYWEIQTFTDDSITGGEWLCAIVGTDVILTGLFRVEETDYTVNAPFRDYVQQLNKFVTTVKVDVTMDTAKVAVTVAEPTPAEEYMDLDIGKIQSYSFKRKKQTAEQQPTIIVIENQVEERKIITTASASSLPEEDNNASAKRSKPATLIGEKEIPVVVESQENKSVTAEPKPPDPVEISFGVEDVIAKLNAQAVGVRTEPKPPDKGKPKDIRKVPTAKKLEGRKGFQD